MKNLKSLTIILTIMMSTNLAAQNPGEMNFSKNLITSPSVESPVTEFKSGDAIYGIAYLSSSIQKIANAKPESKVEVEVFLYTIKPPLYSYQQPMEEQLAFSGMVVSGMALQNNYLMVDIVPEPDQTTAYGTPEIKYKEFGKKYEGPVAYAENLANLPAGKNTLKILIKCNYEEVATGTITIEGNDFSLYAKKSEEINIAAASAGAKSAIFPEAKMNNSETESRMISAFKNSNDWKTGFIDATEVLKIVIIDNDWYVRRHEISGTILHRYIRAALAVNTKSGGCAYYTATFQEDFIGGNFQPLKYDGASVKTDIQCENLK
jgi:hypothetical protein